MSLTAHNFAFLFRVVLFHGRISVKTIAYRRTIAWPVKEKRFGRNRVYRDRGINLKLVSTPIGVPQGRRRAMLAVLYSKLPVWGPLYAKE